MIKIKHALMLEKGFTLVEVAIVLVIVGLMMSAFLMPLSAQLEQRQRAETRAILEQAKEALVGYAIVNKYLPCPDTQATPTGIEGGRTANQCTNPEGVLPWQALGVSGQDGWGRYIRYRVTPAFSNTSTFFTLATPGTITVNSDISTLTNSAAAVLISHGLNGLGAVQMSAATSTDEQINTDGNAVFMSHTPTPQGSANEFDDQVDWLSPNILFNRMVSAGKLP